MRGACPNPRASSTSANRNEFLMTLNRRSTMSAMLFAPEPGLTYANSFMDYSFDQFRPASGAIVEPRNAAVFIDINVFEWVTKKKILGAHYALSALLPFSNSSISSPTLGAIGGGGGFSDSFYQPLTLGWHFKRADIQVAYGFFAPTGRFTAGASDNIGTGHWTHSPN